MAQIKKQNHKNIGVKVTPPKKTCNDKNCPFHGEIKLRGKSFVGTIVKAAMQKTAVVIWTKKRYVPKYERNENARIKIKVHNPPCIAAEKGDKVRIRETRPLSKTKNFVIIEKMGEDFIYKQKEESKDNLVKEKEKKNETIDKNTDSKNNISKE